ncbi:MAG: tetratricopeptide repeat protein, partial [Bacteroidota bacterium]
EYNRAYAYYKELLEQEKGLSERQRTLLSFNLGLVHFYRNNVKLAEEYFRKVRRSDHRFPKIHEFLGELLLRRGAVAEAVTILQTAIVTDPYSWIGHYLLGMAYMRMYDWRNAYEEFVTAVDMDPLEPTTWQLCGEVLIALHQLDEAEQYLRKALELNPHLIDAVANFGSLHMKRGDLQRAREYFEKALSLDPKHHKALQGKAQVGALTKLHS